MQAPRRQSKSIGEAYVHKWTTSYHRERSETSGKWSSVWVGVLDKALWRGSRSLWFWMDKFYLDQHF